jgi:hypothetical protein
MSDDASQKVVPIKPSINLGGRPKGRTDSKKSRRWKSGAKWDTLEHYYRIGWALSDIARLPEAEGITQQAISNRVRRYNWTRNLEPRVADAARAIMAGGVDASGRPTPEALALLRGNKKREDEVVLSSAAMVADRLGKTRRRSARLDSVIDRLANLLDGELVKLEEEAEENIAENNARVRAELNRLTKSVGTLVAAVSRANQEERDVNDLKRLMKPREDVKPLLVKKRAVLDAEDTEQENDNG